MISGIHQQQHLHLGSSSTVGSSETKSEETRCPGIDKSETEIAEYTVHGPMMPLTLHFCLNAPLDVKSKTKSGEKNKC